MIDATTRVEAAGDATRASRSGCEPITPFSLHDGRATRIAIRWWRRQQRRWTPCRRPRWIGAEPIERCKRQALQEKPGLVAGAILQIGSAAVD